MPYLRSIIKILMLAAVCKDFSLLNAQHAKMKFDYLTTDNGLSSNRVTAIYRDSKGYVWIGSQGGLDKYDGYKIVTYKHNKDKKGSISDNNIVCICEDRNKNLWIGTNDGLNLYDPCTETFKAYKNISNDSTSISGNYITSIFEDKRGNLWFTTGIGGGLNKWNPQKQYFTHYLIKNNLKDKTINSMTSIGEDSKGNLWTVSRIAGIIRFDPRSCNFTAFYDSSADIPDNWFKTIYIDKQDIIWIADKGACFCSFNPANRKFKHYKTRYDGRGPNVSALTTILPDGQNHLLIAADQGGINRMDKVSEKFEYIMFDVNNPRGLNNNGVWNLYRDFEGILWVGTSAGGVNYFNPKKERFKLYYHNQSPNSLCYNAVLCFHEDKEGKIWIGTDGGGISIFDPNTEDFTNLKHIPSNQYSISSDVILSIDEDKDHDLWLGTWGGGLNRYERKTGRFYHYLADSKNPASLSGNNIWSVKVDEHNTIWLNIYDHGINMFDKNKGVIKRFTTKPNSSEKAINYYSYVDFYNGSVHPLWICTDNSLSLMDHGDSMPKSVLKISDDLIRAFYEDKKGNLWIGTEKKGILVYKPDGTFIKGYDVQDGLQNSKVCGILEDKHGDLWISTNAGISRLNLKSDIFRNYTILDGLQGIQFSRRSCMITKKGELYFGGYHGFNSFFPDSLKDNNFKPPVYITEFQIFYKPVEPGSPGSPLKKPISETHELVLSYKQSVFSFGFTAINFTHPENNKYSYKMEGFDQQWNNTDASRRFATYTNLDPGEYTFKVRASNNDGFWNEKEASIRIVILPPFWKKFWFKILMVAVVLLILISIYILRIQNIHRNNTLLKRLVEERTKEIEEKNGMLLQRAEQLKLNNALLQESKLQIEEQSKEITSQRDALEQLNATKDKFFSIIGHDLRNPFNTVNGFSTILLKRFRNLPEEKILMYLEFINNASVSGNDLLENLLQWSRSQTGTICFEPKALNLFETVEENVNLLQGSAQKKEISIKVEVDPNLNIIADRDMIKTIFRNLISNAIKFTHPKGVIKIRIKQLNNYIEASIADNGVGIPEDVLRKLFRIDCTVSTKGTAKESGTGLGLILCKEFVEKHNGRIWVESKVNKGSTFYFTLDNSPLN